MGTHYGYRIHIHTTKPVTYTITAYDLDQDEVLYTTDDLDDATANYAAIIATFEAGEHGYNLEDLEEGVTVTLENEDEEVLAEQDFT